MLALKPGDVLGNKYRLIRHLGRGGMGTVWHAQHLTLNAPVALKFIGSDRMDEEGQQRFLGEARMAAALRSPHVVQILDYGVFDGTPHIAMELLEGEALADRLEREGRLGLQETARVIQHVVRAIARAHAAGIVHRDLKPENVFILENDDDELIKVLDFGIAKGTRATLGDSAAVATRSGVLLGTPHYMSPEQVDGTSSVDYRTDIWSLGVLAYRCLLGKSPFAGESVGRLILAICSRPLPVPSEAGDVPAGFDAWFARACARDPAARFGSAREAASAFSALCQGAEREPTRAPGSDVPARDRASNASGPEASRTLLTTGQSANAEVALDERRGRRVKQALIALGGAGVLIAMATAMVIRRQGSIAVTPAAPGLRAVGEPAPSIDRVAPPALEAAQRPAPAPPKATASGPEPKSSPDGVIPPPSVPPGATHLPPAPRPSSTRKTAARISREVPSKASPAPSERAPKSAPLERVPAIPPPDLDLGI